MSELPRLSPTEAAQRPTDVVLLDVREADEWAAGHAPGARHLPLMSLRPDTFSAGTKVLCVCRSGGRSATATEVLRQVGVDAMNVTGGMSAWQAAGLPVVRDDGSTGTVA